MMHQITFDYDNMGFTPSVAIALHDHISNGFTKTLETYILNDKSVQRLDQIIIDFPDIEVYDYTKNELNISKKLRHTDFRIDITGNYSGWDWQVFAKTDEILQNIWNLIKDSSTTEIELCIYSVFSSGGSYENISRIVSKEDFDFVTSEYYPYIDVDELFTQFFTGPENILLLTGLPGLGKSKLASLALKFALDNPEICPYVKNSTKSIYSDPYINVFFVKGSDVLALETFWIDLESQDIDFVVIDDLDNMLTTREAEVQSTSDVLKNKFMNQFLSYTDGIQKRRTKFIITTNQNYADIDSAILREGRLFDILEMRLLTSNEALNIWLNAELQLCDFSKLFPENEITSAKLGTEIAKAKNEKSSKNSYLLDESISKIQQTKKKRKISL